MSETTAWRAGEIFADGKASDQDVPIWLLAKGAGPNASGLDPIARKWLAVQNFTGGAKKSVVLPGPDGALGGVALGMGEGNCGEPSGPSELLVGSLPPVLPPNTFRIASALGAPELAAIAWGLGAYKFSRYAEKGGGRSQPILRLPEGADARRVVTTVEAVWFGRDLINTPASDMGPAEIEDAVRALGKLHDARVTSIRGDDLLTANFPMIHAVGRASPRPPRLIDLTWGPQDAPKITLVGKGITFDTGGLDLKPSNAMLLMKKDMGGAAAALALGHMIMGQKLKCRLRILIPSAENSVSGDAFRPGDVLKSRGGPTVEIGNTDAEGRLVLADALALADEENPESVFVFATLTGAARTALGPDLPAFFTDDDAFAGRLTRVAAAIGDPVWRLPLWEGYNRHLDSDIADMNNVWESPFAGAITAALFLRRFVKNARRFTHFDLYGWRTAARPLGPKGGEPQAARAVMEMLREELSS